MVAFIQRLNSWRERDRETLRKELDEQRPPELREQQQLPATLLESNGTIHIQMLILISSGTADHTKLIQSVI